MVNKAVLTDCDEIAGDYIKYDENGWQQNKAGVYCPYRDEKYSAPRA